MICSVDSSAFVNAIEGLRAERMTLLRKSLRANEVRLAPVVVTELLSKPHGYNARRFITTIPRLELAHSYWERAGILRADLKAMGLSAPLADCLIAQACIDHAIPLITYDPHFRRFEPAGLKLL